MVISRSLIQLVAFLSTLALFIASHVSARDLLETQIPQAKDEAKEIDGYGYGHGGHYGGGGGYGHGGHYGGGGGGYGHGGHYGGDGHGHYPPNTEEKDVKSDVKPEYYGYGHGGYGHGGGGYGHGGYGGGGYGHGGYGGGGYGHGGGGHYPPKQENGN